MLPFEQWLLIAIIAGSTALYVTNRLPTEVTATATIVTLMATGLLSPAEALSGFSSTATITVAAMFVLSAGLMRTGAGGGDHLLGSVCPGQRTAAAAVVGAGGDAGERLYEQHSRRRNDDSGGRLPLQAI